MFRNLEAWTNQHTQLVLSIFSYTYDWYRKNKVKTLRALYRECHHCQFDAYIYIAGNLMQPHATIIRGKHSPPPCNMRHTTWSCKKINGAQSTTATAVLVVITGGINDSLQQVINIKSLPVKNERRWTLDPRYTIRCVWTSLTYNNAYVGSQGPGVTATKNWRPTFAALEEIATVWCMVDSAAVRKLCCVPSFAKLINSHSETTTNSFNPPHPSQN